MKWDLIRHTLQIPTSKRKSVASQVRSILRAKSLSRRNVERVLGSLLFTSIVDPILKNRLKDLNRVWRSRANSLKRDVRRKPPKVLKSILKPWSVPRAFKMSVPLVPPPVSVTIHTDASLSGWGGHTETKKVHGRWSLSLRALHINCLELLAVTLSLKSLNPPSGSPIHLVMDNMTAVCALKRGGDHSRRW